MYRFYNMIDGTLTDIVSNISKEEMYRYAAFIYNMLQNICVKCNIEYALDSVIITANINKHKYVYIGEEC